MGEEEKKPPAEEKKPEEDKQEKKAPAEKPQEKPAEEKKEEKKSAPEESKEEQSPPPPQEIVLKVFIHCEGCARKVRRCLKGFEGVEDVVIDCKTSKVIVKGEKADPLKVLERVQRKSRRQVEILSPIPKPPAEEKKKGEEKEQPKPEEKKEEPQVITVVLKVHMHCEACSLEIKKRILRMKGVEAAEPDLKNSQVTVKGVFDPPKLVEYVHKRTGKHAVIVKQEPEKKEEKGNDGGAKEEKKGEECGENKENKAGEEDNKEKKEADKNNSNEAKSEATTEETKVVELKKNEYNYYYPQYPPHYYPQSQGHAMDFYAYPQIFSDENPNACSVM